MKLEAELDWLNSELCRLRSKVCTCVEHMQCGRCRCIAMHEAERKELLDTIEQEQNMHDDWKQGFEHGFKQGFNIQQKYSGVLRNGDPRDHITHLQRAFSEEKRKRLDLEKELEVYKDKLKKQNEQLEIFRQRMNDAEHRAEIYYSIVDDACTCAFSKRCVGTKYCPACRLKMRMRSKTEHLRKER